MRLSSKIISTRSQVGRPYSLRACVPTKFKPFNQRRQPIKPFKLWRPVKSFQLWRQNANACSLQALIFQGKSRTLLALWRETIFQSSVNCKPSLTPLHECVSVPRRHNSHLSLCDKATFFPRALIKQRASTAQFLCHLSKSRPGRRSSTMEPNQWYGWYNSRPSEGKTVSDKFLQMVQTYHLQPSVSSIYGWALNLEQGEQFLNLVSKLKRIFFVTSLFQNRGLNFYCPHTPTVLPKSLSHFWNATGGVARSQTHRICSCSLCCLGVQ